MGIGEDVDVVGLLFDAAEAGRLAPGLPGSGWSRAALAQGRGSGGGGGGPRRARPLAAVPVGRSGAAGLRDRSGRRGALPGGSPNRRASRARSRSVAMAEQPVSWPKDDPRHFEYGGHDRVEHEPEVDGDVDEPCRDDLGPEVVAASAGTSHERQLLVQTLPVACDDVPRQMSSGYQAKASRSRVSSPAWSSKTAPETTSRAAWPVTLSQSTRIRRRGVEAELLFGERVHAGHIDAQALRRVAGEAEPDRVPSEVER